MNIGVFNKLAQLAEAREVAEYVKQVEDVKRKKRQARSAAMPFAALSLLGVGAGLKQLGDAAIGDEDRKAVDDLIALRSRVGAAKPAPVNARFKDELLPEHESSSEMSKTPQLFMDYIDRASRAAKVKVYGQGVEELANKVKNVIGIEHVNPSSPNLSEADRENLHHYPAFIAGPVPAFLHQHRIAALRMDDSKGIPENSRADWYFKGTPYEGQVAPMAFYDKLEHAFDQYLSEKGTDKDKASTGKHAEQMTLVRDFQGWLDSKDPALSDQKRIAETTQSDAQNGTVASYAKMADIGVKGLQDLPRYAGYATMAAGAGLGGYWLYRFLKDKYGKKRLPHRPEALDALAEYAAY